MATTRPGVAFEDAISICMKTKGVKVEEKAGWIKVSGPHGDAGPRVYLQRRNTVRQVDLSNFADEQIEDLGEGAVPAPRDNGRVQAQLDLTAEGWKDALSDALSIVAHSAATGDPRSRGRGGRPSIPTLK